MNKKEKKKDDGNVKLNPLKVKKKMIVGHA